MKEADALNHVSLFHKTFKHPIKKSPTIPDASRCELRVSLLQEELNELKASIHDGDLVEIADALCDLQYVLSGAILEFGFGQSFSSLFDEVQRSNMSKACESEEEANETCAYYAKQGIESYVKREDDLFLVYRKSDSKTLKSINYSPADLKSIINN